MIKLEFYDVVKDDILEFAVIIARIEGKWILCKHKERDTFECPGGEREPNEKILDTAKRELYEETGAVEYDIRELCAYSIMGYDGICLNRHKKYGMLYYAEVKKIDMLPEYEIEKINIVDELPENWTYPEIEPVLFEKYKELNLE